MASEGLITAAATWVHGGGTKTTDDSGSTDQRCARVCTARLGYLLREVTPGRRPGVA